MSDDDYQLGLFDTWEAGKQRRDVGLQRVEEGADDEWMTAAWAFLVEYLRTHEEMFVDDLWAAGLPHTREDRALGPLFLRASRAHLMRKTGQYRPSWRSNLTEKPVWRSLVFRTP